MSKGKQTTLFQSWGGKKDNRSKQDHQTNVPTTSSEYEGNHDAVIDLCSSFDDDEEDDILLHAEDNFANHQNTSNARQQFDKDPAMQEHVCDISVGVDECTPTQQQSSAHVLPGFDRCAGKLWIYPTNYPVREYQYSIVQQALYKNTMVTLPTGLGKTFIAAVLMYNYYRWYPQGKVVFMAPTKPLVAQQIEACYNIMGIPQEHTAEMTGNMGPQKRETAWHEKRVFFLTPQVLTNDLSRGSCPGVEVKCLVIDEAHKALGNHAYCQVVRELIKYTENFRVLALSATPGSDIKSVQLVLSNLLISHIEIRTEESADIKQYSHERKVEKIVVPLGDELTKVKTKYIQIMDTVVRKLKQFGVLYHRDTTSLSKFLILKAREGFRQNPPERLQRSQYGIVEGDFAMAMSLYHGYELLQLHGSRSLHNFLQNILTGEKAYGRTRTELTKNADFNDLMNMLSEKYKMSVSSEEKDIQPFLVGHPKMEKLQEIVLEHFGQSKDGVTRVMIFSQYRDSVQEITDMLHCHQPMIKVMSFIGQASTGKATKGFTQKEQLMVMKQFREGGYNTLVSTCVGEEGLDIGDVDLIICFDAHKSPIRLVQRMGRTGRKREGKIVMLVTEGKEEQIYNQSQYSKRSIHKAILNGARSLHFYQHSPRMIPEDLTPAIHKMYITVKESFKTDKKLATGTSSDQKKITQAMKESTRSATEEVITLEEYRELKPWLVSKDEIPKLAPASVMCLPPKQEIVPTGNFLSLSEWSPWQTTLQETDKIDHSMATRHFVELMEFIQLQQSLDPGDDPYGLEMAAYLNEDDILKPGESDSGKGTILKFCQPSTSHTNAVSNDTKARKKQMNASKKQRIRRSDALPTFEHQDNDRNNSSDDDLPAFDLGKKSRIPSGDGAHSEHKLSDADDKSNGDTKDRDNNYTRHVATLQQEKKPCKVESKARLLDKRMNEERKRRKRRHTSNQSVIDVIADTDCNDFDNNVNIELKDQSINELPSMFSFNNVLKQTSRVANVFENMVKSPVCKREVKERGHVIGTPPALEEVSKIIQTTENKELLNIDLLKLLHEWNRENINGRFIDVPLKEDISSDTCSSAEDFNVSLIGPENTAELKTECKNNLQLMDSTSIQKLDSKIIIDEEVDSDTDCMNSSLLKTEKSTKVEMNLKTETTDEILRTSSMNIEEFSEKLDHDSESLKSPKVVKSTSDDEMSTASEYSPVFHKSQRRNTSHIEAPSKMTNVVIGPDSPGRLSPQSSELLPVCSQAFDWSDLSLGSNLTNQMLENNFIRNSKANGSMDESLLFKSVKTPHDIHTPNTQVTFTQAFACIHSGSLESEDLGTPDNNFKTGPDEKSRIDSSENELVENLNGSKYKQDISKYSSATDVSHNMDNGGHKLVTSAENSLSDSVDVFEETGPGNMLENKDINRPHPDKPSDSRKPSSSSEDINRSQPDKPSDSRKLSSSSEDSVVFPDFDLGFDVDDDIIPPSPHASQSCVSKVSRLSQAFRGNITQKHLYQTSSEQAIEENEEDLNTDIAELSETSKGRKNLFSSFTNQEKVKSRTYTDFECSVSSVENVLKQNEEIAHSENSDVQNDSKCSNSPGGLNNKSNDNKNETGTSDDTTKSLREGGEQISTDAVSDVRTPEGSAVCDAGTSGGSAVCAAGTPGGSAVSDAGTPGGSAGFQCNSPRFETSFALLDEDLDDWIDSGTHLFPKIKNSDIGQVEECSFPENQDENSKSVIEACDINNRLTDVSVNNRMIDVSVNNKLTDVSVNDKRASGDWFDDSFSCPNSVTPARNVCTPRLETTAWLTSRNSTSTPVIGSSTPVIGSCRKVQTVTPFRSFSETINTPGEVDNDDVNNDDSFIVRRKKKVRIIDSPESEIERFPSAAHGNGRKSEHLKTLKPAQCKVKKQTFTGLLSSSSENDDNFDDSIMLTKNKYMIQKPSEVSLEEKEETFSDSDFEESFVGRPQKQDMGKEFKTSNANTLDTRSRKSMKPKRPSNPFIDEEADLSEEHCDSASSDEAEGSDLDQYDDSFIQDSQCSQSQAVNQSDMQALYLKSLKSPVGHRGGYKLQFNAKNTSVYSQAPPDVESQYMEDSFCVGSEESDEGFDWLSLGKDESHSEVTILHADTSTLHGTRPRRRNVKTFQTSRQRAIHDGRMKALDKIRAKAGNKNSKQSTSTNLVRVKDKGNTLQPKTNRIKLLDESSSEDDNCVRLKKSVIISPEPAPVDRNKKKRPRILSSSDDDNGSFDIVEQSKHTDQMSTFQGKSGGSETDLNLPLSLKERIRLNSAKRKRTEENKDISKNSFPPLINTEQGSELVNEELDIMTKIKRKIYDKTENLDKGKGMVRGNVSKDLTAENNPEPIPSAGVPSEVMGSGSFSSKPAGKAIILVDSKELSGAQDVISDLRFKHNIQVSTASNLGCDFIVSNRMAVERKQWSEFSNGANRSKLIERLQQLQACYDRSCLIVEKDRVKSGEEKSKNIHWTKYVHKTCAMLLQSPVQLLFSENQGETAVLLADLCNVEQRKTMAITGKVDLTPDRTNMIKFYTSLPNVTYVNALNLCNRFSSVKEFMSSSVAVIEEKGKMSKVRATEVYYFIRRDFDQHMLPTKYS